ncbi:iron-containing alcohol dehydrogenase 1 [Exidia glandulosa HHB12029]|uniref:hydroxyacid-oxoacid transhydrogenase n=1 Tax=Exidia glandulosa HHB12029 TaxID=1314781 RepID=A0A165L2C2_EXIGL|nr:iron-containing alcohol dehydrogenase 1 [Exidia glandulosa HHB12029]
MAARLPTRNAIFRLMNATQHGACPCHGCRAGGAAHSVAQGFRRFATPVDLPQKEYAFEIAAANLRFGDGVTSEVGMDFKNQKATKIGVFTDRNVAKLLPMRVAMDSLQQHAGAPFEVFENVSVEPTEDSFREAMAFARKHNFSHFLAVGGGSVMDTAKAANLFTVYPEADLFDFINAPVGKGLPIAKTLRPLIAIPTTAGTGSETTGTAILDIPSQNFKTGIANRALRPILGVVDTRNTESCPTAVHISSGLDVLFHAMESYTAIPYYERTPRPSNPLLRPAYQGSNPIADIFSLWAVRQAVEHLPRIAKSDEYESRHQMLLAATFAGIAFGNAGVHLCHGISYPISGLNKTGPKWQHPGYKVDKPIIPHGVSVALTGPAVFRFTAPSAPSRHRELASVFSAYLAPGTSLDRLADADLGPALFDAVARFLDGLGLPRGLRAIGYKDEDVPRLVKGAIPQRRVLDLAPGIGDVAGADGEEHLTTIVSSSMAY